MTTATHPATICSEPWGTLPDGRPVQRHTLQAGGLALKAIDLGGIVTELWVPDAQGQLNNVVLGFDRLADYATRNPHFSVIVGRYGNRIANGRFELDGVTHELPQNDGPNCLHGGPAGFGKLLWLARPLPLAGDGSAAIECQLTSPDGDAGFPGEVQATVRYTLGPGPVWRVDYSATSTQPTVVNLTQHAYFNLAGGGSALGHELQVAASRYLAVNERLIPERIETVAGTPFDFRQPHVIGERVRDPHPQLAIGRGYDHHFMLDAAFDGSLRPAATLRDPASGRQLRVLSTEPGLQVYSGNFLDGSLPGHGGRAIRQGDGICLETQHNPNSPNHAPSTDWPSVVLRPGEVYRSRTEHHFS